MDHKFKATRGYIVGERENMNMSDKRIHRRLNMYTVSWGARNKKLFWNFLPELMFCHRLSLNPFQAQVIIL